MTDSDLLDLRRRAAEGDRDAIDQLVELAGERGDWTSCGVSLKVAVAGGPRSQWQ
jgi:hypothetical protein